jgi:hypothetical protein
MRVFGVQGQRQRGSGFWGRVGLKGASVAGAAVVEKTLPRTTPWDGLQYYDPRVTSTRRCGEPNPSNLNSTPALYGLEQRCTAKTVEGCGYDAPHMGT